MLLMEDAQACHQQGSNVPSQERLFCVLAWLDARQGHEGSLPVLCRRHHCGDTSQSSQPPISAPLLHSPSELNWNTPVVQI